MAKNRTHRRKCDKCVEAFWNDELYTTSIYRDIGCHPEYKLCAYCCDRVREFIEEDSYLRTDELAIEGEIVGE